MNAEPTTRDLDTYRVLVLCAVVILLEGFDIQAAGVSAPRLTQAFALQPLGKGLFLGASAVGIFISAVLGGVLADRFGRRPVVAAGVAMFGLCSLGTLLANGLPALIAARFLTGLGLGAAMPAVIAYASDHSPERMKKRAVGFIYCAIPIGGLLSGVVMQASVFGNDWRAVYLVGGLAPVAVAPVLWFLLPRALPGTHEAGDRRPNPSSATSIRANLLGSGRAATTGFLWTATFGTLLVMYLLLGWMPSLLVAMGLSQPQAQYVQMIYNVGSSLGAASGGYLLDRGLLYSTAGAAYGALAVLLAVLGFSTLGFSATLAVAFGIGAAVTVAQALLYAFAPLCYPAHVRTTGVGAAVAAGRLGTIAGPLVAGSLLGAGSTAGDVLAVLIPITLLAGAAGLLVVRTFNRAQSALPR
jgi:MFS transporter, AAHS family, 3-hydroxyphenylpropionic acid transporter